MPIQHIDVDDITCHMTCHNQNRPEIGYVIRPLGLAQSPLVIPLRKLEGERYA
jgi:hypothetical protein